MAKGYTAMGETALGIGANTFAFFTRNPRGSRARPVDRVDVAGLGEVLRANEFGALVAHAPYVCNPASNKASTREFALTCLREDLARLEMLPGGFYNLHPGSHVGAGAGRGIELIITALAAAMAPEQRTTVLLETMTGKGTEIGGTFEELAAIIEGVLERRPELSERIGVCFDTCHVSDAGYDIIDDLDGVLERFDTVIGLARLRAVHVNDSKSPRGSRRDRHARIGEGYLGCEELGGGLDVFGRIVRHPALSGLPLILETPNELDGYAAEIRLLRGLAT